MSWREYIGKLSDSERHKLLEVILENEVLTAYENPTKSK